MCYDFVVHTKYTKYYVGGCDIFATSKIECGDVVTN